MPNTRTASRRRFLRHAAAGAFVAPVGAVALLRDPSSTATSPPSQQATTAAFLAAVERGEEVAVRRMLENDPGLIHARTEEGLTAFGIALQRTDPAMLQLVREHGYLPDLVEAAYAQDWDRVDALAAADPAQVNVQHALGGTAMHAAARGGAGSDIWRIYQYSGNPNIVGVGPNGRSPARAALEFEHLPTAELTLAALLSNGADPNLEESDGNSALHAAAARGSVAAVDYLLRKDARVDATDAAGHTPLDLARRGGHEAVVRLLSEPDQIPRDHSTSRIAYDFNGAPYRAPELGGFDARLRERMVGQSHFNLDVVRELSAQYPPLVHAVASTTERTVEACAHTGQLPVVEFLLERGAPYSLPTAVVRGDRSRAQELLDEDPLRINERGAHDFALLWYPVIGGGNLELAELLLDRGAEIERHDFLGTTALHHAAQRGQNDMVELLISRGADINRVGRKFSADGQTPLDVAESRDQAATAELLRARGARTKAQ